MDLCTREEDEINRGGTLSPGRDPARNRAGAAAFAGLGSLGIFVAALVVFGLSTATGVSPIGGGEPSAVTYVGMFGLAPAIAAFGAALPARFLGAGWSLSLLTGIVVVAAFFWTAVAMEAPALATAVLILAPAVVTFVGSAGTRIDAKGIWAMVAVSAVLLVLALSDLLLYPVAAAGWVILPAIAGFFQASPRR